MRGKLVTVGVTKLAVVDDDGDRKSADAYRALAAAKDAITAAPELWKHSRRDCTTRFQ